MKRDERFTSEINFRDIGGYITIDGRTVKSGCFYRSGGPYRMNTQELEALRTLGLKAILDMRTKQESTLRPDPEIPGATFIQHSGLVSKGGEDIDFSPVGMSKIGAEGEQQLALLTEYYKQMPFGNEAIQVMFDQILSGNVPILIHCATGKDRTGVAAIALLLALGVSEDVAFEDFMLSCKFREVQLNGALKSKEHLFEEHPEVKELIIMKEGVSERIGKLIFEEIHRRYSTTDDYLQLEYGLTQEQLNYLRDTYTQRD